MINTSIYISTEQRGMRADTLASKFRVPLVGTKLQHAYQHHLPSNLTLLNFLNKVQHIPSAPERECETRSTMSVRMHDLASLSVLTQPQFPFYPHVVLAERSQALYDRSCWVQFGILQSRHEVVAPFTHLHNFGRFECKVEFPLVGLGESAEDQYVVVAWDDEDDLLVAFGIVGDGVRLCDFGESPAVIDNPNECASKRVHRAVRCESERRQTTLSEDEG